MIVGTDKWAWAHIPRTAGDTIRCRFGFVMATDQRFIERIYGGLLKHLTFEDAGAEGPEYRKIVSFRRLPSWWMSWIAMMCGKITDGGELTTWQGWVPAGATPIGDLWPDRKPFPVPSLEHLTGEFEYNPPGWNPAYSPLHTLPDRFLDTYLPNGMTPNLVWTCEDLEEHLEHFFRRTLSLEGPFWDLYNKFRTSKATLKYDHDPDAYFKGPDVIEMLYAANPRWAQMEQKWYGGLWPGLQTAPAAAQSEGLDT